MTHFPPPFSFPGFSQNRDPPLAVSIQSFLISSGRTRDPAMRWPAIPPPFFFGRSADRIFCSVLVASFLVRDDEGRDVVPFRLPALISLPLTLDRAAVFPSDGSEGASVDVARRCDRKTLFFFLLSFWLPNIFF